MRLVEKEVRDFKMLLDTEDAGMSANLLAGKTWEGGAPDFYAQILQPWHTVIEMGACLGFYMLLAAKRAGKVYAIEADADNVEIMCAAKKLNAAYNVNIYQHAVSSEDGTARFNPSPGRSDRGRLSEKGVCEVETLTLDTFVEREGIEHVDVIRCDIEGAEVGMVQGGFKTLHAMKPGSWLFIDLHPAKFKDPRRELGPTIEKLLLAGFKSRKAFKLPEGASFTDSVCKSTFPKVFFEKVR